MIVTQLIRLSVLFGLIEEQQEQEEEIEVELILSVLFGLIAKTEGN